MAKQRSGKAPWERANPRKKTAAKKSKKSKPLSGAQKAEARARARKAGRPYPNLVDNMAVARKKTTKR